MDVFCMSSNKQVHENMLYITNHQGNANQTHSKLAPHTCQSGCYQKCKNNKCWQGCGEKETLVPCCENANWCSCHGKH